MSATLISLGANIAGRWGCPLASLRMAALQLGQRGVEVSRVSALYQTEPLGNCWQPHYLNAVILAKVSVPPAVLLRLLKGLEREAGRRTTVRWGPRPLDLDIVDFAGHISGWPPAYPRSGVIVPHPEMHRRSFVLTPLIDVAPHWQHPVLKTAAKRLLSELRQHRREVRRVLDSQWISCD
jgi:2-amino-4-hydroxy-6-hydroxymethyldihydropteridine diphosphokinase